MILRIAREKVGHRQGPMQQTNAPPLKRWGVCICARRSRLCAARHRMAHRLSIECAVDPTSSRGPLLIMSTASSPTLVYLVAGWDWVRASAARKGAFLVVAVSLLLAALMLVPDREN